MKPRNLALLVLAMFLTPLFSIRSTTALGAAALPDLHLAPPRDVFMQVLPSGEHRLKFSTPIQNIGEGPLIIRREPGAEPDTFVAVQEIMDTEGNLLEEIEVGTILFDPDHEHFHMDDISIFQLHTESPDGPVVAQTPKISVCFFDNTRIPQWPGQETDRKEFFFDDCHADRYGLNVGWQDVYPSFLPNQWVVVTGVPDGEYYLTHSINDPDDSQFQIHELDTTNNENWVKVLIFNNGHNARVIRE